jgi:Asp-tRNA(Asn)/Glu-tRNA(Gln) amidotransferase B subunit
MSTIKTSYASSQIKDKRNTIKDRAQQCLDKHKESALVQWINEHIPGHLNATQNGVSFKNVKPEVFEELIQWVEYISRDKDDPPSPDVQIMVMVNGKPVHARLLYD